MSYILDALRKADAQRERDAARGIHAQPAAAGATDRTAAAPRISTLATLAAGILLAAAAGWYATRGPAPAATTERAPAPAMPQVPARQPVQAPAQVANAILPAPVPAPAHEAANAAPSPMRAAPQAAAVAVAQPSAQAVQAAPPTAGLPPDAPKVAISGGVYSPDPTQRMLIVNGQVFNEGSEVAPGLSIEKIEARTATLKFRGARYTVAY